jgi:hypothetical protein
MKNASTFLRTEDLDGEAEREHSVEHRPRGPEAAPAHSRP